MDIDSCIRESVSSIPTASYNAAEESVDDTDALYLLSLTETFSTFSSTLQFGANAPGHWETANSAALSICADFVGDSTVYTLVEPNFEGDDLLDVPISSTLYVVPFVDWIITS